MLTTLRYLLENNHVDFPISFAFILPKTDSSNNTYSDEYLNDLCNELITNKAIENIPKTITISHNDTLFYITWIQNLSDEDNTIDIVKTRFEKEILIHVKLYGKLHKIDTYYSEHLFKNPYYTILP
jgi:hypothetical protein